MSDDDWSIPNYILDGDNCSDDYLNSYKNQINMLNGIANGQAVTTCANRKLQVELKKALGLNHVCDANAGNDDFNSSSLDGTRDSSFVDNNNNLLPILQIIIIILQLRVSQEKNVYQISIFVKVLQIF